MLIKDTVNKEGEIIMYQLKRLPIEEFIGRFKSGFTFTNNAAQVTEDLEAVFTEGNCYYFALILKSIYTEGRIIHIAPINHFVLQYDNSFYDITGKIDIFESHYANCDFQDFENLQYDDPIEYNRLMRDCILKIDYYPGDDNEYCKEMNLPAVNKEIFSKGNQIDKLISEIKVSIYGKMSPDFLQKIRDYIILTLSNSDEFVKYINELVAYFGMAEIDYRRASSRVNNFIKNELYKIELAFNSHASDVLNISVMCCSDPINCKLKFIIIICHVDDKDNTLNFNLNDLMNQVIAEDESK